MYVTTYCVHSQDDEGPLIINAVSDAVKRHPNLVEVTVDKDCSVFITSGLLKGMLQKEDAVRKVDVMESLTVVFDPLSKSTDVKSSECECLHVCVVSACLCGVCVSVWCLQCVHMFIVCLHVFSYHGVVGPRLPHTCNEERVTEGSVCLVDKEL